jgi:hypothetical protein
MYAGACTCLPNVNFEKVQNNPSQIRESSNVCGWMHVLVRYILACWYACVFPYLLHIPTQTHVQNLWWCLQLWHTRCSRARIIELRYTHVNDLVLSTLPGCIEAFQSLTSTYYNGRILRSYNHLRLTEGSAQFCPHTSQTRHVINRRARGQNRADKVSILCLFSQGRPHLPQGGGGFSATPNSPPFVLRGVVSG